MKFKYLIYNIMNLQKHIKNIFITLFVISLTAVWYAAVTWVTTWETLTADLWNWMKMIVDTNEAKLVNISNDWNFIGIGTQAPQNDLHIVKELADIRVQSTSNVQSYILLDGIANTRAYLWTSKDWGLASGIIDWDIVLRAQWADAHIVSDWGKITLDTIGNVWIWTTTPSVKLDVNWEIKATSFDLWIVRVSNTCTLVAVADPCYATCPVWKYIISWWCSSWVSTRVVRQTIPYSNTQWLCKANETGDFTAYALCWNITPW